MNCPFCHDAIDDPKSGVQCAKCATAHHRECWDEHNKCTIQGCESREFAPMRALSTARRAIAIGREITAEAYETARERMGGKSTVTLFLVSAGVAGLGAGPLLYAVHASTKVDIEVVLGGLFVILAAWITGLVYRGAKLDDDANVKLAEHSPTEYIGGVGKALTGHSTGSGCSGCADLDGCPSTGTELDAIIGVILAIVALVVIIFVVLPVVAWLAVEIVFPLMVLVVYGTLYHALAFAVNDAESCQNNLGRSLRRGLGFAFVYTALVAILLGGAVEVFHGNLTLPHRF